MKHILLQIPDALHRAIKQYALDNDTSMKEAITKALEKLLNNEQRKE